jgi:hypothetical protein
MEDLVTSWNSPFTDPSPGGSNSLTGVLLSRWSVSLTLLLPRGVVFDLYIHLSSISLLEEKNL